MPEINIIAGLKPELSCHKPNIPQGWARCR